MPKIIIGNEVREMTPQEEAELRARQPGIPDPPTREELEQQFRREIARLNDRDLVILRLIFEVGKMAVTGDRTFFDGVTDFTDFRDLAVKVYRDEILPR